MCAHLVLFFFFFLRSSGRDSSSLWWSVSLCHIERLSLCHNSPSVSLLVDTHSHTTNWRLLLIIAAGFSHWHFKYYIKVECMQNIFVSLLAFCLLSSVLLVSPFLSSHTVPFGWFAPPVSRHVSVFLSFWGRALAGSGMLGIHIGKHAPCNVADTGVSMGGGLKDRVQGDAERRSGNTGIPAAQTESSIWYSSCSFPLVSAHI